MGFAKMKSLFKMKKFRARKRADISVSLLVIMTFVLVGITFFVFVSDEKKILIKMQNSKLFDVISYEENKINFYINEAIENSINVKDKNNFKLEFIENFKNELKKYEIYSDFSEYSGKIREQLTEDNVQILNNTISIEFKGIKISKKLGNNFVSYSYNKKFEKNL